MSSSKVVSDKYRVLADRQMRRWDLQHRAEETPRPKPCVAISRMPGAGGAEVGRRVAEALDYGFFGRETVDEIGRGLGLDDWLMGGLDEHVRTGIDRFGQPTLDPKSHRGRSSGRRVGGCGGRTWRGRALWLPPGHHDRSQKPVLQYTGAAQVPAYHSDRAGPRQRGVHTCCLGTPETAFHVSSPKPPAA